MKKIVILLVILGAVFLSGCKENSSDKLGINYTQTIQKSEADADMLNDRQKDILQELGLPAEYEDLTVGQRGSIQAIEEMLCYLESKYGVSFTYSGYIGGEGIEKEHLIAFPTESSESGTVEVYRTYENGTYSFTDNYSAVLAQPLYEEALSDYFKAVLPANSYRIFISVISANDIVLDSSNILSSASISGYFLVDERFCDAETLTAIITDFGNWMQEQSNGVQSCGIAAYLVGEDFLHDLVSYDYQNQILGSDYRVIVTCSLSNTGNLTIR